MYVYQLSLTDEKGSAVRNPEQRDNRQIAREAMMLLQ
jgi:hypothetical protein